MFGMKIQLISGFEPDFNNDIYLESLESRIQDRINFIAKNEKELEGRDALPKEALEALTKLKESIFNNQL